MAQHPNSELGRFFVEVSRPHKIRPAHAPVRPLLYNWSAHRRGRYLRNTQRTWDELPCSRWNSNTRFQHSSDLKPRPQTSRLPGSSGHFKFLYYYIFCFYIRVRVFFFFGTGRIAFLYIPVCSCLKVFNSGSWTAESCRQDHTKGWASLAAARWGGGGSTYNGH